MIPAHIQRMMEYLGTANPDGVSRRARTRRCRCGSITAAGLDADTAALPVTTEVTPVNSLGEILTIAAGRKTYTLTWRGDRYEIDVRDPENIAFCKAEESRHPVVAEHHCGTILGPECHQLPRLPRPVPDLGKVPF